MLTRKKEVESIVEGFRQGTDGYLGKPFNLRELMCRVEGLLQRPPQTIQKQIQVKDLILDKNACQVYLKHKLLPFRKKEYAIFSYLMGHPGHVINREQIINNVWEVNADPYIGTIDVHISNIRKILGRKFGHKILQTVHGFGYKLNPDTN